MQKTIHVIAKKKHMYMYMQEEGHVHVCTHRREGLGYYITDGIAGMLIPRGWLAGFEQCLKFFSSLTPIVWLSPLVSVACIG